MLRAPVTPADYDLLRLMTAGDARALEQLYERHQGGIYRFALRMSGSEAVAEDVTQDVFMALMRDSNQYDPARGSLQAYLYGMARHRVLRRLERDRAFVPISDDQEDDAPMDARLIVDQDPMEEITRNQTIESVRQAISALPVHYREVVVLCNLQEMNYEDAARVIGCPVGTVRSRLHRARAMLIDKLQTRRETGSITGAFNQVRCAL
ncbi:MAG TPA: RNA polymerase sigma factor [Blastocatellia bacterium]